LTTPTWALTAEGLEAQIVSVAVVLRDEELVVQQGDAYDLIPQVDRASVDAVVTSPPYWGHRSYEQTHNWDTLKKWREAGGDENTPPGYEWYRKRGGVLGLEPFPDWYVAHLVEIIDLVKTCLKDRGSLWVNLGDTYFARWSSIRENGRQGLGETERQRRRTPMGGYRQEKQLLLVPARFAIAMQERRWILRNDLIWYKPNLPPRPEKDRLRLSHEHFFHFVKRPKQGRARYYYDLAHVEPALTDVVTVPASAGQNGHSATFPERLIVPRILSSSPQGGLILDPFCGTGRTLSVAVENGRRSLGFDISEPYVSACKKLAVERRLL
jgi:site-specific DNA-methyltransferase (cytosine-N4-specific)